MHAFQAHILARYHSNQSRFPGVFMYESKSKPPLSRPKFVRRLLLHVFAAAGVIAVSLIVGVGGYIFFEGIAWHDAVLNTTMILGGMGPATLPQTLAGKLFVGFYGLCTGLIFVTTMGMILAPVVHRILHKFHWDRSEDSSLP